MIEIILFVAACLVWQSIKDKLRGKRKPTVSLCSRETHVEAMCGCDTANKRVVRPCSAHRAMLDAGRD